MECPQVLRRSFIILESGGLQREVEFAERVVEGNETDIVVTPELRLGTRLTVLIVSWIVLLW